MKHFRKTAIAAGLALGAFASIASADVTFYGREDFRGRSFTVEDTIENLDATRFNDRASSIVVRGGQWLVCSDAYFRGDCVRLRPGDYPSLAAMGLNDRISSARELRGDRYGRGDRDHSRVVLYEGPNFSGRSMVIDREQARNLDRAGFNDRATSLRVEGGPWTLCSDAFFQGECRTFNPGDYPYLPEDMNNRISSAHRAETSEPYAYRR